VLLEHTRELLGVHGRSTVRVEMPPAPRAQHEVTAGEDGIAQLRQLVAHESWHLLLGVAEVDFFCND
jgi:hypothetical protein